MPARNSMKFLQYLEYLPYLELILEFRDGDNARRDQIIEEVFTLAVTKLRPTLARSSDARVLKLVDDLLEVVHAYLTYGVGEHPQLPATTTHQQSVSEVASSVKEALTSATLAPSLTASSSTGGYSGSLPAYPLEEESNYHQPPMDPRWAEITKRKHQPDGGKGIKVDPTPVPAPAPPTSPTLQSPPYDLVQVGIADQSIINALRFGHYTSSIGVWPAVVDGDVLVDGAVNGSPAWMVLPRGWAVRPGWTARGQF